MSTQRLTVGLESLSPPPLILNSLAHVAQVPDDLKGEVIHQTFPFNYFLADMRFDRKTADRLEMWAYQVWRARETRLVRLAHTGPEIRSCDS